jgi:hypothetical protein
LLPDIRLVWHSGGVAESELETLLCRQREVNASRDSLLHTMCSVDADSAAKMLDRLRSGAYDKALELRNPAVLTDSADVEEYPWERELRLFMITKQGEKMLSTWDMVPACTVLHEDFISSLNGKASHIQMSSDKPLQCLAAAQSLWDRLKRACGTPCKTKFSNLHT